MSGQPTPTLAESVPARSWSEFTDQWQWAQGEHLTVIGPTKSGKTTLVSELLRPALRCSPYVCIFASKRRDPLFDDYEKRGYKKLRKWVVSEPELMPRVLLAPKIAGFSSIPKQAEAFREAMDAILRQGGWTLVLNEARYIASHLGLTKEYEVALHQGRTEGVTVVSEAQRPRHLPLLAYDQATHLFFFRNPDTQSLRRLGEIGGAFDARAIQATVARLPFHHFLYVHTEEGTMFTSAVEL